MPSAHTRCGVDFEADYSQRGPRASGSALNKLAEQLRRSRTVSYRRPGSTTAVAELPEQELGYRHPSRKLIGERARLSVMVTEVMDGMGWRRKTRTPPKVMTS
jgi:hypothetical protein